ncbi:hypothetical protein Salat_0675200 [Sesamum alatum]|uniref:Uncharacterized protein n=1 Tax=Sesamum alatum TaxID=300844 RepID=A0AAE1YRD9_9LAMI|nr:hypothetical protein Salat_0675200 [Sesamum alatum]
MPKKWWFTLYSYVRSLGKFGGSRIYGGNILSTGGLISGLDFLALDSTSLYGIQPDAHIVLDDLVVKEHKAYMPSFSLIVAGCGFLKELPKCIRYLGSLHTPQMAPISLGARSKLPSQVL